MGVSGKSLHCTAEQIHDDQLGTTEGEERRPLIRKSMSDMPGAIRVK